VANKSIGQRIVEGIALVLVAMIAVSAAVVVASRYLPRQAGKPQTPTKKEAAGPQPQRERVESVDKLPVTYPAITELVMVTDPPPAPPDGLAAAEPAALAQVKVRHLNAYTEWTKMQLSPGSASMAIVQERTPAGTIRLAVWDLESGKLLRFLSGEVGKTPRPYQGKENADFGAKVDLEEFQRLAFSPSGKRLAARQGTANSSDQLSAYIWDISSGKLLSRFDEAARPMELFNFAHEDHLVLGIYHGSTSEVGARREDLMLVEARHPDRALLRIVASTGEAELLVPIGIDAMDYGVNAVREGKIAFRGLKELHSIDITTRQHLHGEMQAEATSLGLSQVLKRVMWFAPDGAKVYGCTPQGGLETWDVATCQPLNSLQLAGLKGTEPLLPAPEAGLVLLHEARSRNVHVFDVATGNRRSVVQLPFALKPFQAGRIQAISSDARRLLVSTDQLSLLVIDFPQGLPRGTIDLAKLLGKSKLPATR
jgi:hypothetical protein